MSKSSNIVCSLIAAALLAGCAAGTNFEFDQARMLQIGMSESEVTSLIGKPYSVVSKGTEQIWVWSYYETFSGQSKTLSVIFENGKTKQVPNIPESFE